MKQLIGEETMKKRHWQVRRHLTEVPDGQQRWNQAYQLLLSWTLATTKGEQAPTTDNVGEKGRDHHASSSLRSGLHAATDPDPND